MFPPVTPSSVGLVALVIVAAGVINGVAGFGFALIGTMALATAVDPATAVVFMIVPILAAGGILSRSAHSLVCGAVGIVHERPSARRSLRVTVRSRRASP